MTAMADRIAPLADLLSAHAGRAAPRHRAIWAFDARLADVARATREPAIGQMRLAWWYDVVTDATGVKGQGEPVVDGLRTSGAMSAPGLVAMLDGWEIVVVEPRIDRDLLLDYATGRGGGLFRALADAQDAPAWLIAAGRIWALWDLAGHVQDRALAALAVATAQGLVPDMAAAPWPRAWKPLRIAATLAWQDIAAGRAAPPGLSRDLPRGLALRLLRIALVGR